MIPYATFAYFGVLLYAVAPLFIPVIGQRYHRAWLIIATLGMLVVQYWTPLAVTPSFQTRELALVVAYGAFQLLVALAFLRAKQRGSPQWVFYLAVALGLAPLVVAKLSPVLASGSAVGFLGISWVTFRSLDVIFLIQDKVIQELSVVQYLAYTFFFATISSGPIDRYRRFAKDWQQTRTWSAFVIDLDGAVQHIFRGFLYKFVLAVLIQRYWLDPLTGHGVLDTISYMYAYGLYLFFDFAGYSAFAIGVSYLFGVHTPENFNRPFLARDIKDFWNRWNITLSHWFRDHVYLRFMLTATRRKWFKNRYTATYIGYFLLFGLMGLWHGPKANYIAYGLYHGSLMAGQEAFARWNKTHKVWGDGPGWTVAGVLLTVQLVFFGFLIFSGRLF